MTKHTYCHKLKLVKYVDWNKEKNELLKLERGISFEEVAAVIASGEVLDIVDHTNKKKYPNQQTYIVEINHYAYLVPFVEDEQKIFLKTIIPSRKATKKYLIERR